MENDYLKFDLSIPFIGFRHERLQYYLKKLEDFQFPLLGSTIDGLVGG